MPLIVDREPYKSGNSYVITLPHKFVTRIKKYCVVLLDLSIKEDQDIHIDIIRRRYR